MATRVGVILSGCGYLDGSEIHEAVSILIALDRRGADIRCAAPDIDQADTINHVARQPGAEKRNVLVESARIARSKIRDLARLTESDLEAVILPGGFGAAKNLSDFAAKGAACKVNPEVTRLLADMHRARKPIGLACIAPVLAAKVLGDNAPALTIGTDRRVAAEIEKMGGKHHDVGPAEVYVDAKNLLVTTPCYMNDVGPWVVFQGAERLVEEVLRLTGDTASMIREQMATLPK
jgi:enhancing lycopene biosynthesis protein 2